MSVQAPVRERVNNMREEDGLSVAQGLCGIVANDASDDDGRFSLGEDVVASAEEGLWLCCAVGEVQIGKAAEETGENTLCVIC